MQVARTDKNKVTLQEMAEFQFQFFTFSARGFINKFFNDLISSWSIVVDEILIPGLVNKAKEKSKLKILDKNVKKLQKKLLDRIFQHGKLDLILRRAQEYAINYLFAIPQHITLPGDMQNLEIGDYDEKELQAQIVEIFEEIIKLRCEHEFILAEQHKVRKCLEICAAAENEAEDQI